MKKKLLVSLATLLLFVTVTSCTSSDTSSEEDADIVSNAEIEEVEGADVAIETTESAELSESLPENSLAEASSATDAELSFDEIASDTSGVAQVERVEETPAIAIDESSSATPIEQLVTDAAPASAIPADTGSPDVPMDPVLMSQADSQVSEVKATPKRSIAPLQKITSAPYMVDSKWVNAVYIARPGDSLKSISRKIYGEDRSKELKKINTAFKSRSVKPGDKIYYNSPMRPDDSSKISLYFEENGAPSQTYVAQKGDNIRKISKKLLGYDNAWKEVWASNPVESKYNLQEGEVLRYWPTEVVTATTLARAEKPAPDMMAPPAIDPPVQAESLLPPPEPFSPPPPDMASAPPPMPDMSNSMPPPPPPDMMPPPDAMQDPMAAGMGEVNNELPPPPPEVASEPVVAEPTKQTANMNEEAEVSEGMDVQSMGLLGAIGLFAIALVMIVISKKRKQKEQEALMSETHVGSM